MNEKEIENLVKVYNRLAFMERSPTEEALRQALYVFLVECGRFDHP